MSMLQQRKFKVLLIGDACIDVYQYGLIERLSPEAPVPVFRSTRVITMAGMAGNVERNLTELGLEVIMLHGSQSTKTRLIDERSRQHVVRIDDDIVEKPLLLTDIDSSKFNVDAVIFSDYNKGFVTYELVEDVRKKYGGPIFIDTKKSDLSRFNGCYVKINEAEYEKSKSINDQLIVTLGNRGAMWKQEQQEHYYSGEPTEVVDVCGAGDTFLAGLVYEYLNTRNIEKAIKFANRAAAITVQHMGVYAPKLQEIK